MTIGWFWVDRGGSAAIFWQKRLRYGERRDTMGP